MASRIVSLLIIIAYMIGIYTVNTDHGLDTYLSYIYFILPFACIWFGDELGSFTGYWNAQITSKSSGGVVRFMGWVLLILPIIIYFIVR